MQYQEKELFQGYEIKNWNLTPQLSKLFAAAAIFNILFLFVVVQAQVFTTRGCDSPLVGNFCQVLDTIYLGGSLLDTNTDFVSKEYQKTQLEDAEITYIDVTNVNNQPLNYPEGYFALANPESAMMQMPDINGSFTMPPTGISGFPTNPTIGAPLPIPSSDLLAKPQVTPTPNAKAVVGKPDDSLFEIATGKNPVPPPPAGVVRNRLSFGGKIGSGRIPKPKPEKTPEEKKPIENQPELKEVDSLLDDGRPNNRPLEDFGKKYGPQILNKEIDVNAPFTIEVAAELDENGKFINPKVITKPGSDEKMTEIAKEAIAAFSDTKLLRPLYEVGSRKIKITFSQNQDNLQAIIQSETKSDSLARTMLSLLNLYLKNVKLKEGSDEAILLEKAQFATQGKNFIINFLIENQQKNQMIEKSLKGLQEKLKNNPLNNSNNIGEIKTPSAK